LIKIFLLYNNGVLPKTKVCSKSALCCIRQTSNGVKLVIPTNNKKGIDDTVAEHFGRCLTYTFLNEKGEIVEIIDNTSEDRGGKGLPPELIKEHKADILLCKDIGPKALILCKELGTEVYIGQAGTVKEMFEMWKNNKIKKASKEDVCEEHKL